VGVNSYRCLWSDSNLISWKESKQLANVHVLKDAKKAHRYAISTLKIIMVAVVVKDRARNFGELEKSLGGPKFKFFYF